MYSVLSAPLNKITSSTFKLLNSWYAVSGVPANAMLNEDGTPFLTEDGEYMLTEE